jgi:hypothetical protein
MNETYNGKQMSDFAFYPQNYSADNDEGWYGGSVLKVVVLIYFRFVAVQCNSD